MVRGRSARWSLASVVLAAALLLTAGCTGSTTKDPDPTTTLASSTPTPTPSPTPTEAVDVTVKPERPQAMDAPPTADGAVAVAEYFLQLYPYVYATGDLAEWKVLSHLECVFCASVVTNADKAAASGQHDVGGAMTIIESTGAVVNEGSIYSASVTVVQAPSATLDMAGKVIDSVPDELRYRVDVALIWDNGGWRIREATPVKQGNP